MDTKRDIKGTIAITVVVIGILIAAWYGFTHRTPAAPAVVEPADSGVITALFQCDGGRAVQASFDNSAGNVRLTLSDGRELTLPHAISADGARYANTDESFVFWNKGNTAFITEIGTTTYSGCVTQQ
ncbi:MliC family protein [Candidatus Kaiserbacteria bacterium]|nr:MliC family protein [Candidatus Kaiserbacteria bacterium]